MKVSNLGDRLVVSAKALIARHNYARALQRLRQEAPHRKIKVAFFVSELEKWKGQSVFDALTSSSVFDPFIVVMNLPQHKTLPHEEQLRIEEEKAAYFRNHGMPVVRFESDRWSFDADIVFYQQPWGIPRELKPFSVSRRALTFYFPYYTPNLDPVEFSVGARFNHLLYGQIVLDAAAASAYSAYRHRFHGFYAGSFPPLGHPALDELAFPVEDATPADGCVIYAPHWSVDVNDFHPPLPYSTFPWSGTEILSFAKTHPEIKWAFKPHPKLRSALVESGLMTEADVEAYYANWARIGESCYDGPSGYVDLFRRSRAMITDCGSFLTEYGCTGKPIIHLISPFTETTAAPPLYATYYRVRNGTEMQNAFARFLIAAEDPNRAQRLQQVRASRLNERSADRIVTYLKELLHG